MSSLLAGALLGLAVAVPIGPMGLLCIERTLALGIKAGLATGAAASTVHFIYGTVAAGGLGALSRQWLSDHSRPISAVLAMVLFALAIRIYRRKVRPACGPVPTGGTLANLYASAVAFGFVNPMTLVLFVAAAPLLADGGAPAGSGVLAIGIFLGSLSWWLVLVSGVHVLRLQAPPIAIALSGKIIAAALAVMGLRSLLTTFGP